jgi:hypothetical protein
LATRRIKHVGTEALEFLQKMKRGQEEQKAAVEAGHDPFGVH